MEFALVDGVRSAPLPGAVGQCQNCCRPMVAKCGKKIRWHWAHHGERKCDAWWENEGPWHREWKRIFPPECREVVGRDANGEAHIADIKLESGLVIELQHSQISPEELRSREEFYGEMIWIVDAEPFKQNIWFFDPLPDPALPFVDDLVFFTPHAEWRNSPVKREFNFDSLMFYRGSERDPNLDLVEMHSGRLLSEYFPQSYRGHHLFHWHRPRDVWLQTTKQTFLDFGGGLIFQLMRYGHRPDAIWCVRKLQKDELVNYVLNLSASDVAAARIAPAG